MFRYACGLRVDMGCTKCTSLVSLVTGWVSLLCHYFLKLLSSQARP